jgi:hypothetical protein
VGAELRIFRSLLVEWDRDSINEIRVELTRGAAVSERRILHVLESLAQAGYVREQAPERWEVTSRGRSVSPSLLGELRFGARS